MASSTPTIPVIPGIDLGPQVFIGERPDPLRLIPAYHDPLHTEMNKPGGGLWTSSEREDGTSGWIEWCQREDFGGVDVVPWWRLVPRPDTRLLRIDDEDEFRILLDHYGTATYPGLPERLGFDFDAMVRDGYDGLHATERGFWSCRMSDDYATIGLGLYTWDCESTVWFHWGFEDVQLIRPGKEIDHE